MADLRPPPETLAAFELAKQPVSIDSDAALRSAIEGQEQPPKSIGVYLSHMPSRRRGHPPDPRVTPLHQLAVSLHYQQGRAPVVWIIECARVDLQILYELWSPASTPAPYVLFFDAHQAGAALARVFKPDAGAHLTALPLRFGCIRTATTLLAAGTSSTREARTLHGLATRLLQRELPGQIDHQGQLSADLTSTLPRTLACAAAALVPMMRKLTPMLRKRGLVKVYGLECEVLPAVLDMELAGMTVDARLFQQFVVEWERERAQIQGENPGSEVPEKAVRSRLARLGKLISNFGHFARDFVDLDGRVRCHLDPLATDSGRFACSRPNLQQIPGEHTVPGLRKCFTAAPGYRLVIADYAQIELRVAAHLAGCPVLRQVFVDGRDPHRATASQLARKPEVEISTYERKLAKAVNFGFLFGMGAKRFRSYAHQSYGLDLDQTKAQIARDRFFATYPGISQWHRQVGRLAGPGDTRAVTVRTALGRRKHFPAGSFSFTAALNIPVQGTAADGFKLAMIKLLPLLRKLGGRGVLCVHDEYIAEVPEAVADDACVHIQEAMEQAMAEVVTSVPIVVEAHVADTWG